MGRRYSRGDSVSSTGESQITLLLHAWRTGDPAALERLTPLIYEELRRLARRCVYREQADNTLQTTALVNEAFVRLVDVQNVTWQDRAHFFAVSAQVMRRILIDAARSRRAEKRGGQAEHVRNSGLNLDEVPDMASVQSAQFIALNDALEELARVDERKARVIELRFFGGLSVTETADVLRVSPQSVMRDWKLARAWLMRELRGRT